MLASGACIFEEEVEEGVLVTCWCQCRSGVGAGWRYRYAPPAGVVASPRVGVVASSGGFLQARADGTHTLSQGLYMCFVLCTTCNPFKSLFDVFRDELHLALTQEIKLLVKHR